MKTKFTLVDAERASGEWGANCGPGALAAVLGITLDEVRPHMGDFERKHYTNPTLMFDALRSLGVTYKSRKGPNPGAGCWDWPIFGLCRIQWEGPWTKPGVPIRARYRHTHWIGVSHPLHSTSTGIFDINCINNGSGWVSLGEWRNLVVPWLLKECVPRADGKWHVTHSIDISPQATAKECAA
jgi:hypothetical protein